MPVVSGKNDETFIRDFLLFCLFLGERQLSGCLLQVSFSFGARSNEIMSLILPRNKLAKTMSLMKVFHSVSNFEQLSTNNHLLD